MTILSKQRLLERAEDEDLEVTDRGGGWFEVEGQKVRGLDAVEERVTTFLETMDCPWYALPCLCGCGGETKPKSKYLQGHDARLKSILLKVARGEEEPDAIPDVAQPYLEFMGGLFSQHEESITDVLQARDGTG